MRTAFVKGCTASGRYLGAWWAVLTLAGVFLAGCSIKKPEAPRLNFTWRIPVANDTTTIREVAEDRSEFLEIDQSGLLNINFSSSTEDREEVGERLRIKPQEAIFETPIGNISIPGQSIPTITLSLDELIGQDIVEGEAALIPSTPVDVVVAAPLDDIQSIMVEEGGFELNVANRLPVDLQNVRLTLIDNGRGGTVVDAVDLGTLPALSGLGTGAIVLDGRDISGDLAFQVSGNTVEGNDVAVAAGAGLDIDAGLSDLVVSAARAVIPQQTLADNQALEFPDDRIQVQEAIIREGGLTLKVRNDLPLIMDLDLSLDDLTTAAAEINVFTLENLIPGETREVLFDLTDNQFTPVNPLELRLSYQARTFPSDEPVTLEAGGVISIEAVTQDLVFSRVQGVLNGLVLPVEPEETEVDFPDGLDNIGLSRTSMEVYLTSGIGFRSQISLDIEGTSNSGQTARLVVEETFARGDPQNPVNIVVRPQTDALTNFLNLLPSQLVVTPTVRIGDGVGTETVEPSHWVRVDSVVFQAPARFRITGPTQVEPDPIHRENTNAELRDWAEKGNILGSSVITTIENRVPLGVKVSLRAARRLEDVYRADLVDQGGPVDPDSVLAIPRTGTFEVVAAAVDENGRPTQTNTSKETVAVTSEDILFFLQEGGVYTGILVQFDATDGDVELNGEDFVLVQAGAEITAEIDRDIEDLLNKD
ncbi:MAG: hypothetical protein GKR89_04505 [Candidatus Latescibacteria bacterium]|nr:hypothetical protein [Candidatus Latescibacterota bacterium]